ncbi:N-acetyltransferase [Terrabacter sp. Root181]|uniref:GNAT family N-acetyltransferase n=1 Tax=Terrabacter sp. Root181 TaxID=1736484 RepID=UPI000AEC3FDC|nr:GNAT family N-acetyltransferase [Terrabacter sp. Root181]
MIFTHPRCSVPPGFVTPRRAPGSYCPRDRGRSSGWLTSSLRTSTGSRARPSPNGGSARSTFPGPTASSSSEGAVAGFAATRGDEFLHFGIAVDHWGSGLATLAHDDVLDHLRDRGIRRARLRVFTGNGRGRRFYEKHGWEPTGERSRSSFAPCPELLGYARPL